MSEVNAGWTQCALGDVVRLIRGVSYTKDQASSKPDAKNVPILRATNIDQHLDFDDLVYVPKERVSAEQLLKKGDIVIAASSGSKSIVGKAGQLLNDWHGSFGAFCMGIRPNETVEPKYVGYFLQSKEYRSAVSKLSAGSNINNLKREHIQTLPFQLAPKPVQSDIVRKIEELFSDLDAGVAALKRAQANLKRYRAAVLKAAVEGGLTKQWRAERKAKGIVTEPAAQLLARILAERRKKWEAAQLKKYADAGKAPPKGWQNKYPEPAAPLAGNLPTLPVGWGWASLDQMSIALTSGSRDWSQYYDRGSGVFIMAQNVRPWRPDFSHVQLVDPPLNSSDRIRSMVKKDDLLVTIVGANTGDFCRVEVELNDYFVCQSVALIRPALMELSAFINAWFNSDENGQRYFDKCMYGQGRPHLGFEELKFAPIAMPPFDEQTEIVAQVEAKLSNIAQAESEIKRSLERATRLRQAILKRAFEGGLV